MTLRTLLLLLLFSSCWLAVSAQAQNAGRPTDEVIELGKVNGTLDMSAARLSPNRRGLFDGVNLSTQGIVISGREYPGAAHEIPAFVGNLVKPVYAINANTPVRFHIDGAGIVRAVWIDGELQE